MILFLPSYFVSISLPLIQDLLFFFLSYFFELIEVLNFPLHPISFPLQILKFHPLSLSCVVILEIWTFTFNLGWSKCNQYLLLPKHRILDHVSEITFTNHSNSHPYISKSPWKVFWEEVTALGQ